ncbi:TetR/AcrR family transcriptional regulator [Microbacterium dauci]|uniref:TetR/AcrR family transcriptional regulator n=1 Tax=Microbacterium dauci TaxID=3048008 RepID=A0ABT6ZGZ1_9MICO|nr:TetR/AcrR family transcriptional regulator [Microbacterium sp. LX3-4]MDJ1115431.1 TetR/AcrR family transcriptional regulator [Microbacterium sp. LX3-4]
MFSSELSTGSTETKSDRTRRLLRDIALRSFRERGYDATTIRHIAAEAGVSVGTTNYHFASKNDLVQELYLDVQDAHAARAAELSGSTTGLIDRLRIAYETGLDEIEPYHPHAPEFLSAAMSPRSPINPLSTDSADALRITESVFRAAVTGADHRLPADIAEKLPRVFVLGHLLLALFWVYDSSPEQRRTRLLLGAGLTLLGRVLPVVGLPGVRGPVRQLLDLVDEVQA